VIDESPSALQRYGRFVAWTLAACGAVLVIGYLPTRSLGGEGAIAAMVAGCLVSVFASLVGGIPVALARRDGLGGIQSILASFALRFIVVMATALAVALSGYVDRGPFLVWVGISYLACLVADTRYALAAVRGLTGTGADGE